MHRIFGLLCVCLSFSISAQKVVVWDFATRDGKRTGVTTSLTAEFEEALVQKGAYSVLERRNLARLQRVITNEKALQDIGQITEAGTKTLKQLGTSIVIFGELFDDVDSGDVTITVTFQEFSGKKLLVKSVLMRRALVHDTRSRRDSMTTLVDLISPPPTKPPDDHHDRSSLPPPPRPQMPSGCSGVAAIKSGDLVEVTLTNCGDLMHLLGIDFQPKVRVKAEFSDGTKAAQLLLSELWKSVATWQANGADRAALDAFAGASEVWLVVLGNRIPIKFQTGSNPTGTGASESPPKHPSASPSLQQTNINSPNSVQVQIGGDLNVQFDPHEFVPPSQPVAANLSRALAALKSEYPNNLVWIEQESGPGARIKVAKQLGTALGVASVGYFAGGTSVGVYPDAPITVAYHADDEKFAHKFVDAISCYVKGETDFRIDEERWAEHQVRFYLNGSPSFSLSGSVVMK
jgi:hypothetical protein